MDKSDVKAFKLAAFALNYTEVPREAVLRQEKFWLKHNMRGLEMGDDFLFSNRNGNLPLHRSWEQRIVAIDKELKEMETLIT